ncbi:hypothetical protein [Candidatus Nitrosocosmicus sp. R]
MGINFLSQLGMDLDFESRVPRIETPNLSIKNVTINFPFLTNMPKTLRKTRRNSLDQLDFSIINYMIKLPRDQIEYIYKIVSNTKNIFEESAFCAAATSYTLGEFHKTLISVQYCLQFDNNVEEYWHLLAYALRHMGKTDSFNKIIFGNARNIATINIS